MVVKRCKECPFYQDILLAVLANKPNSGLCGYDAGRDGLALVPRGLRPGPERDEAMASSARRLIVPNNNTVPDKCPLRAKDIVLTLGD